MPGLIDLQRQFQALVIAGHGDPRGLIGSGQLGIYAHAYGARLLEALRADHPKLEAALGEAAFAAAVAGYVAACPPSSFTLRDLGVDLGAYLDRTPSVPPWAGALARLERARVEVFDARDARAMSREDVAALAPVDLPGLALAWVPASAVVDVAWSVDDTWSAIEDDVEAQSPTPTPRTVLVWRRELEVIHRTLEPDEAALAPALAAGTTFASICERLAATSDAPAERAIELLLRWLDGGTLACPAGPG